MDPTPGYDSDQSSARSDRMIFSSLDDKMINYGVTESFVYPLTPNVEVLNYHGFLQPNQFNLSQQAYPNFALHRINAPYPTNPQFYGSGWAYPSFMSTSAISPYVTQNSNASNAYRLSLQACTAETKVKAVSSYSSVSSKFKWKISEFSKLNAQHGSYSDVFAVGNYKWKVRIHPKGEGKVYDHLSVYLKPVELTETVETEFSIAITSQTDPSNTVRHGTNHKYLQRRRTKSYGWPKFMPLSEIYDPDKGYIVNDTCVITIEVTCIMKGEESNAHDGGAVKEESNPDEVPESKRRKIN